MRPGTDPDIETRRPPRAGGPAASRRSAAALACLLASCSTPAGVPAPGGDASPEQADAGESPAGHRLQGVVIFDRYNGQSNIPARSRSVGVVEAGVSTLTDRDGRYALTLPSGGDLVVRATLDGEVSVQRSVHLGTADASADLHVLDIDALVGSVARLGFEPEFFEHGVVAVRFLGSARGGYGAQLGAAHVGSFVLAAGQPVALEVTRSADDTLYFHGLLPGTTTLALSSPDGLAPCADSAAPGTTQYPVTAGTMTEIVLRCP